MKRIAPVVILFLFAMIAWNMFSHSHGIDVDLDGDDFDGPVGAVIGLLFAGGGLLIGGLVALFVGAVLAVVFAGVGVVLVAVVAVVAVVVLSCVLSFAPSFSLPCAVSCVSIWSFLCCQEAARGRAALHQRDIVHCNTPILIKSKYYLVLLNFSYVRRVP